MHDKPKMLSEYHMLDNVAYICLKEVKLYKNRLKTDNNEKSSKITEIFVELSEVRIIKKIEVRALTKSY